MWSSRDRYGIWANDTGDDSIDTVISHIDTGHLDTFRHSSTVQLNESSLPGIRWVLTLAQFSTQTQLTLSLKLPKVSLTDSLR